MNLLICLKTLLLLHIESILSNPLNKIDLILSPFPTHNPVFLCDAKKPRRLNDNAALQINHPTNFEELISTLFFPSLTNNPGEDTLINNNITYGTGSSILPYRNIRYNIPSASIKATISQSIDRTLHNAGSLMHKIVSRTLGPAVEQLQALFSNSDLFSVFPASGIHKKRVAIDKIKAMKCLTSTFFTASQERPINIMRSICNCFQHDISEETQCNIVQKISQTLGCSYECNGQDTQVSVNLLETIHPSDPKLSLELQETSPTPIKIPKRTVKKETFIYFFLWNVLSQLSSDANFALCGNSLKPRNKTILPGWDLYKTFYSVQSDSENGHIPLAQLWSRRNKLEKNDFLIAIRGTKTSEDWKLDFAYNHVSTTINTTLMQTHRGFTFVASLIWESLQPILKAEYHRGTLRHITVTGHSLGAGVSVILSFFIAKQFHFHFGNTNSALIQAIVFGCPKVGPAQFNTDLSNAVNLRVINAELDIVPQTPCNMSPACPSQFVSVPTGRELGNYIKYEELHGQIPLLATEFPAPWRTKLSNTYIEAWHSCAYDCWTSSNFNPSSATNCWPHGQVPHFLLHNSNAACSSLPIGEYNTN